MQRKCTVAYLYHILAFFILINEVGKLRTHKPKGAYSELVIIICTHCAMEPQAEAQWSPSTRRSAPVIQLDPVLNR